MNHTRNVLVTGAKGFIGRQLSRDLYADGLRVAGIGHGSIPPTERPAHGLHDWVNGDVDLANLYMLGDRIGPFDQIFHLAGGSHVGRSFEHPAEDFHRTVTAASQLFEWIRLTWPKTPVVVVSSAAVYGAGHEGPIAETAAQRPFSPYGTHKAMLETLARSYCNNFGLNISICRLFSVFGEGLKKQLIFELCNKAAQAETQKNSTIWLGGSGHERRDWIHVSDVSRLLRHLINHCSNQCLTINGGSGDGIPISVLANLFSELWGQSIKIKFSGKCRPGDPESLIADTGRLDRLGFQCKVNLQDGLQRVIDDFCGRTVEAL